MQKILYKTKTIYSIDEYSRYNKTVQKVINKSDLIQALLFILMMISAFIAYRNGHVKIAAVYAVIAIVVPFLFRGMFEKKIKAYYSSNPKLKDMVATFTFYKDHMSQDNSFGHGKVNYSDIYKIIETKTNYYIMLSKTQGSIIVKENCSDNLKKFLDDLKNQVKTKK